MLLLLACLPTTGTSQDLHGEIGIQGILVPGGEAIGILSTTARPTSLLIRGGYGFTPNIAAEIDLGIGVSDARSDIQVTDQDNPIGELPASALIGADVPIKRYTGVFAV